MDVRTKTTGLPNTSVKQLSLCCVWRRLADAASALMLVLTAVPTETVRAVAVTGASTGELLWASPVGQVARSMGRKWGEATVDLPKARAAPWSQAASSDLNAPHWRCLRSNRRNSSVSS